MGSTSPIDINVGTDEEVAVCFAAIVGDVFFRHQVTRACGAGS